MSGVSEAAVEAAATAMYDSVAVLMRFPTGWDEAPDSLRDSYRGMARAALPAIRADIAAEVQAATWDEVGGSMWFDRHQWGVIIDGLVLQRAEALTPSFSAFRLPQFAGDEYSGTTRNTLHGPCRRSLDRGRCYGPPTSLTGVPKCVLI